MRIVRIRSCIFVKTTPVWAEIATEPGMVKTKEGVTNYSAGNYIVSNDEQGTDSCAVCPKVRIDV